MVKVYDFIISEFAQKWRKNNYTDRENKISIDEMEKIINEECKNIKSINTNTYTSYRHNNGDTDEVHIVFTVICE
jgi:hypothetical protein